MNYNISKLAPVRDQCERYYLTKRQVTCTHSKVIINSVVDIKGFENGNHFFRLEKADVFAF